MQHFFQRSTKSCVKTEISKLNNLQRDFLTVTMAFQTIKNLMLGYMNDGNDLTESVRRALRPLPGMKNHNLTYTSVEAGRRF